MTLRTRLLMTTGLALIIVLAAVPVCGAESTPDWRPTYDIIMRWINFIILAGLLIKYAFPPLKHFLNVQQKEINSEIRKLETEKQTVLEALNESIAAGKAHDQRIEMIKGKIVAEGENRKKQIISEAQKQCEQIMVNTRRRIENDLQQATQQLRTELVDAAVDQAEKLLPDQLTAQDNARILDNFINVGSKR